MRTLTIWISFYITSIHQKSHNRATNILLSINKHLDYQYDQTTQGGPPLHTNYYDTYLPFTNWVIALVCNSVSFPFTWILSFYSSFYSVVTYDTHRPVTCFNNQPEQLRLKQTFYFIVHAKNDNTWVTPAPFLYKLSIWSEGCSLLVCDRAYGTDHHGFVALFFQECWMLSWKSLLVPSY